MYLGLNNAINYITKLIHREGHSGIYRSSLRSDALHNKLHQNSDGVMPLYRQGNGIT